MQLHRNTMPKHCDPGKDRNAIKISTSFWRGLGWGSILSLPIWGLIGWTVWLLLR